MPPRLLTVDSDDSFTFMLVDQLRCAGADVKVVRASDATLADAVNDDIAGVVLSPGPGHPADAHRLIEIAAACMAARRPLLGICLGHQAMALALGGTIRQVAPVHGKSSAIHHDGDGLFIDVCTPFAGTRYHSLAVEELPSELVANAWTEDGIVMGMRHRRSPAHGLQFHPESVATVGGMLLLRAFVKAVEDHT